MTFDEMTPELVELAKQCETLDERMAFISDNGIELSDEQMAMISGGGVDIAPSYKCPAGYREHDLQKTGNTKPGSIWGDVWPNVERRCTHCGYTDWYFW